MRTIVVYELVSLDGVAEEPGDWMFDVGDAVLRNLGEVISSQDDVLLERHLFDTAHDVRRLHLDRVDTDPTGAVLLGYSRSAD